MLVERYRRDPRTPELSENVVVFGWVDVAGPLLIQKVEATLEDPGVGTLQDVLYSNRRLCRVEEFILADPGTFQD